MAQSSGPPAVAVRAAVTQLIAEGRDRPADSWTTWSTGTVRQSCSTRRPAGGRCWSGSCRCWRDWRPQACWPWCSCAGDVSPVTDGDDRHRGVASDLTPEAAAERRAFLTRSLADADAEYLAGDLSDQDYLALRQRDMSRLAALTTPNGGGSSVGALSSSATPDGAEPVVPRSSVAVDERASGPGGTAEDLPSFSSRGGPGGPTGSTAATGAGGAGGSWRERWSSFAGALVVAVSLFASDRLPGQIGHGELRPSPRASRSRRRWPRRPPTRTRARSNRRPSSTSRSSTSHPGQRGGSGPVGLARVPDGPAGEQRVADRDARRPSSDGAVRLDPGDYAARLYLGTVLFQRDGDAGWSREPVPAVPGRRSTEARWSARPPRSSGPAYQKAGVALPSQVAARLSLPSPSDSAVGRRSAATRGREQGSGDQHGFAADESGRSGRSSPWRPASRGTEAGSTGWSRPVPTMSMSWAMSVAVAERVLERPAAPVHPHDGAVVEQHLVERDRGDRARRRTR